MADPKACDIRSPEYLDPGAVEQHADLAWWNLDSGSNLVIGKSFETTEPEDLSLLLG